MRFKRNQVEAAISRVLEGDLVKPSSELRTRLKRLLDTDRGLGRNKRSADPGLANFAFYSENAPGRGAEIWFSTSEAFALLTALRLMQHGWPQGFAVSICAPLGQSSRGNSTGFYSKTQRPSSTSNGLSDRPNRAISS